MGESKKGRRTFIRQSSLAGIGLIGLKPFKVSDLPRQETRSITIVHSNDMHSHIDPFATDHPKYPGLGGMAERAALIDRLRKEHGNILLLDAGDIFQGTPYFNYFNGKLELELMSKMGYDAATIGNHDFDIGLDGFAEAQKKADFPYICSNYLFEDTLLEGRTISNKIFRRNGIKVGVFGLGVELEGLVDPRLCEGVRYVDPIMVATQQVRHLRHEKKCDMIICLSHLGYAYEHKKVSDQVLASKVEGIDLIIGGHTHTFLERPVIFQKNEHHSTYVNQVGWAGVKLGVLKFDLAKEQKIKGITLASKTIGSRV
jgi:5'-nucleotidase